MRLLALDFGTVRVGAALSDPRGEIASPLETYHRRTPALDAKHYRELVEEEGVERIVIGLPLLNSGDEDRMAGLAREFGAMIARETKKPVVFFEERYTSKLADELMRDAGLKSKGRKDRVDRVAALILLQDYIAAGRPDTSIAGSLQDRRGG